MTDDVILARLWSGSYLPSPDDFQYIVNRGLEHRPWFSDDQWALPEPARRALIVAHLSRAYTTGCVWSVLRNAEIHGILLLEDVSHASAQCHFLFFDHELRNKRQLCLAAMADAFRRFDLQALRVEVPTYAADLIGFLRKALGFKFEAEWSGFRHRGLSPTDAKRGSRKVRTIQYKGEWHDALLLSVTRDGFVAFAEERYARTISQTPRHLAGSGPPAAGNGLPAGATDRENLVRSASGKHRSVTHRDGQPDDRPGARPRRHGAERPADPVRPGRPERPDGAARADDPTPAANR